MVVERWTIPVRPGCQEEVVKTLREDTVWNPVFKHDFRIYAPFIGPRDVVVVEWEYQDMQEMEACWDAWRSKRGTPDFFEKWRAWTERGGQREFWELAAAR